MTFKDLKILLPEEPTPHPAPSNRSCSTSRVVPSTRKSGLLPPFSSYFFYDTVYMQILKEIRNEMSGLEEITELSGTSDLVFA